MWFTVSESVRSAIHSIRAHRLRSFLTTLGIIIGVASVVAMVSIIQGLSFAINQQFQGLGSNGLTIRAFTPMEDRLQGRYAQLTPEDLELITYRIDGIESITPILNAGTAGGQIRYGAQTTSGNVVGTTYSYQRVSQIYARFGRFLSDSDDKTRRRVAVVGEEIRKALELPENPVGEYISINGEWLKIIGLMEPKGEVLGQQQDNFVALPYGTLRSMQGNRARPNISIQMTIRDIDEMESLMERIRRLLRDAHDLRPEAEDDFTIQTAEQLTSSFTAIIGTVTIVMGGIVSISLLVGGIGIMNIMLVSVTERTREIGICKAIGAKRFHILLQFLLEALVLCLIGGLIGLAIGYTIGVIASAAIPGFPPAYIPAWAIGLALGFSGMVGLVFGILPAAKAAKLDPIQALRYE